MARTQNKLDQPSQRRLEDWLRDNWKRVKSEKLTKEVTATLATAELAMPVTIGNLRGAAVVLALDWPKRTTAKQLDAFRRKCLRDAVAHLYRAIALPAPSVAVARYLEIDPPEEPPVDDMK